MAWLFRTATRDPDVVPPPIYTPPAYTPTIACTQCPLLETRVKQLEDRVVSIGTSCRSLETRVEQLEERPTRTTTQVVNCTQCQTLAERVLQLENRPARTVCYCSSIPDYYHKNCCPFYPSDHESIDCYTCCPQAAKACDRTDDMFIGLCCLPFYLVFNCLQHSLSWCLHCCPEC